MHGFFIFQQKYTKFAGLELIEKNKCLKNKTKYKSRIKKRQPREAWFSSWFDTLIITSCTKSETIPGTVLYG
jgi:hypothetical protein